MTMYDAIESLLRTIVPEGCRIYQANMPLQVMDTLARETAQLCTYMVYQDRIHRNSSGATPVHNVVVEFSFYGTLADSNQMTNALSAALIRDDEVVSEGWRFILNHAPSGKRDVWEPKVQVKREYVQFSGIAIEPETEGA